MAEQTEDLNELEAQRRAKLAELREQVDREFYILSEAHYDRYMVTPDLFSRQGD